MESRSSPAPTECIGTDSIINAYPNVKTILGGGSFGVVFATRLGNSRLAVKVVHCGKQWRAQVERLQTEVMPLTMSARKAWKHVSWANRAFVHENLASDLSQLIKKVATTGAS